MAILEEIYKSLKQIKNGEISFQTLINRGFDKLPKEESYLIKDSVKSIINRYYFLLWEQNKIFPVENEVTRDYLVCALGQYHYVKEITNEMILDELNGIASSLEEKISIGEFYQAMVNLDGKALPIPDREYAILNKRLSLLYAYPEWICKMMTKHFGVKKTYKSIASSRRSVKIALNCNLFLTNQEKIVNEYPNYFEKGALDNSLHYIGGDKLIEIAPFKNNLVFVEDETNQLIVEKLNLELNDTALLIADDRGLIALDMAIKMKDIGQIHVMTPNIFDYNSITKVATRFKIHSLDVFQSPIEQLITHVERKTCDKVLLIAPSSSLGLIRKKPDILLTLKKEQIDGFVEEQKKQLEEASLYVKNDGIIEYVVYTYNKKESNLIIEEFLNNHKEFSLVEEKQIFAYETPSDGAYYAIMKKN